MARAAPTGTTSDHIPIKDFIKFSNKTTVLPLSQLKTRKTDIFPMAPGNDQHSLTQRPQSTMTHEVRLKTASSFYRLPEYINDRPPTTLTTLRPPRVVKKSPPLDVNVDLYLRTQEKHKEKF